MALPIAAPARRPDHLRSERVRLPDGAETTLHVAAHPRASTEVRVVCLPRPEPLAAWCARSGVPEAIVGGFFARPHGRPLGELRTGGVARASEPFDAPWHRVRACVHVERGVVAVRRRAEPGATPRGHQLQAGPLLVGEGISAVRAGEDPEGFSAGRRQFDSDITVGRYPRAALALTPTHVLAVACDGRAHDEVGMTLAELADALVALGAEHALNLDGGGSTSLVCAGELRNVPRAEQDRVLDGGRAISTALAFLPRA
jgi:hypothetical protein